MGSACKENLRNLNHGGQSKELAAVERCKCNSFQQDNSAGLATVIWMSDLLAVSFLMKDLALRIALLDNFPDKTLLMESQLY